MNRYVEGMQVMLRQPDTRPAAVFVALEVRKVTICHSRAGGNPDISLAPDPRLRGGDKGV
jgi:hypothetical protein